jgi:hypothetical protein
MNRSYNCKDEELPVLCRFSAISLRRDLNDFTAYSPKLSAAYLTAYESGIAKVEELLSPASETAEMKKITDRIHSGMIVLQDYVNHLGGYLEMAGSSIDLSAADFGLSELRKGINNNDPEKVLDRLRDVNKNVEKYKAALSEQGFTDTLRNKMVEVYTSLNADRQLQYQILTNRKALVQSNVGTLNDLNNQLTEVLRIGKILYRGKDAVKLQEYTLSELKKRVRRISKSDAAARETAVAQQGK